MNNEIYLNEALRLYLDEYDFMTWGPEKWKSHIEHAKLKEQHGALKKAARERYTAAKKQREELLKARYGGVTGKKIHKEARKVLRQKKKYRKASESAAKHAERISGFSGALKAAQELKNKRIAKKLEKKVQRARRKGEAAIKKHAELSQQRAAARIAAGRFRKPAKEKVPKFKQWLAERNKPPVAGAATKKKGRSKISESTRRFKLIGKNKPKKVKASSDDNFDAEKILRSVTRHTKGL
ncbi:MAG: hypothetical protein ACTSRA_00195 [Promethearchaeota archaeon]|nr:MAG: hypothetical protein [Helarchaeota virus Nidhogg Meg22_1012]URC17375.1 MAG: hypothetical protein [Helarchaeota virus Nidhogg Meg22_1214]